MRDFLPETASQTAGPYVHIGLAPDAAGFHIFERNFGPTLTTADTEGERITIEGRVIDGSGTPVRDVLLEIWQANAAGRYNHPDDRQQGKKLDAAFRGWGRSCSDFTSGVLTAPGTTTETPMLCRARSKRSTSDNPRRPYLLAL